MLSLNLTNSSIAQKAKRYALSALTLILSLQALSHTQATAATTAICPAKTFYVSSALKNMKGIHDGTSWKTAWTDFDQIDWSVIRPGDTITIDGGKAGGRLVYTKPIKNSPTLNGTKELPITITTSDEDFYPLSGSLSNSILYGGKIFPGVIIAIPRLGPNNFQFKTTDNTMAISDSQIDPKFVTDVSKIIPVDPNDPAAIGLQFSRLFNANFSLKPNSPAIGSGARITSIKQLFSTNQP